MLYSYTVRVVNCLHRRLPRSLSEESGGEKHPHVEILCLVYTKERPFCLTLGHHRRFLTLQPCWNCQGPKPFFFFNTGCSDSWLLFVKMGFPTSSLTSLLIGKMINIWQWSFHIYWWPVLSHFFFFFLTATLSLLLNKIKYLTVQCFSIIIYSRTI